MSIRKLPVVSINERKAYQWAIPESVLTRYSPVVAKDTNDATISIFEGIGEQIDGTGMTAKRVAGILRAIDGADITVAIHSPGGDFFEGLAIYNVLREYPGRVTVKIVGLAASAASIIAMAGDEIQMSESAFIMIHRAWSAVVGNRRDLEYAIKALDAFDNAMADIYSARTGRSKDDIIALMDGETWLSGVEAVNTGFADAIVKIDVDVEENGKAKALRIIDVALARQGFSRSQRRALLADIYSTPSAADRSTPGARHDEETAAALRWLLTSLKED